MITRLKTAVRDRDRRRFFAAYLGGKMIGLALALWSLGLLAVGLRATFELPWRGAIGAMGVGGVMVAALAVVPSVL